MMMPIIAQDRIYRSEVYEIEYRHIRKEDRGDHSEHETKALPQVRLGVWLCVSGGNYQVYDEDEPESIDEPGEDRRIHAFVK
jgi:hypothetical protein